MGEGVTMVVAPAADHAVINNRFAFSAFMMLVFGVAIASVMLILMATMRNPDYRIIRHFSVFIPIISLLLITVVPLLILNHTLSKKKQEKGTPGNTINYRPLEPSRSGKE